LANKNEIVAGLLTKLGQSIQIFTDRLQNQRDIFGDNLLNQLVDLYNAMTLWLQENRFVSNAVVLGHLNERYCPTKLKDVTEGNILRNVECQWRELLPLGAILKQVTHPFQDSDSEPLNLSSPISDLGLGYSSGPSRSPPVFAMRQPLVTRSLNMSDKQNRAFFDQHIDFLKTKAQSFKFSLNKYQDLDRAYLTNIRNLYTHSLKKLRIDRKCGQRCSGSALVQFQTSEVKIVEEIKNYLQDNRIAAETLAETDSLDPKICLSALLLVNLIDGLCAETDDSNSNTPCVNLFYHGIQTLTKELRFFPPILLVVETLVEVIGSRIIRITATEVSKIYDLVKGGETSLVDIFNPAVAVAEFPSLYLDASAAALDAFDNQKWKLLNRFSVGSWLTFCAAESRADLRAVFFENLLACLEPFKDVSHAVKGTDDLRIFHEQSLVIFLTHTWARPFLVESMDILLEATTRNKVSSDTLSLVLLCLNNQKPFDYNVLDSTELLHSVLTKDEVLQILVLVSQKLHALGNKFPYGIYSLSQPLLDSLVSLCTLLICSQQLYSIMSDVQFAELSGHVRKVILPFLGVKYDNHFSEISLAAWPEESGAFAESIVGLILRLPEKMYRHSLLLDKGSTCAWELYSTVVLVRPPGYMLSAMQKHLQNVVNWELFVMTQSIADQVMDWKRKNIWSVEIQRFICHVIVSSKWDSSHVLFKEMQMVSPTIVDLCVVLIANSDVSYPSDSDRKEWFDLLSHKLKIFVDYIPTSSAIAHILSMLPDVWPTQATTLFSPTVPTDNSLHFCLHTVLRIANLSWDGSSGIIKPLNLTKFDSTYIQKWSLVVGYLLKLISAQVSSVHHIEGSTIANTFSKKHMPVIVNQLIGSFEMSSTDLEGSIRRLYPEISTLHGTFLRQILVLFNEVDKGTKDFIYFWDGLTSSAALTCFPSGWIAVACQVLASAEHMALLVEKCMDRSWELLYLVDPSRHWNDMISALTVPEIEAETFTRHCLNHSLISVLYTHALQKLDECRGNSDMRIVIGEGIGIWITGLKIDTIADKSDAVDGSIKVGAEGKAVLLLSLFADLLHEELSSLPVPEHHSRLRAHLPAIADILLKWGEDRASGGLWATLGFGPRSRLTPEFRLFARTVGTFIALRLITYGSKREEENKARLIGTVSSVLQNRDFERCWDRVPALLDFLNDEDEKRLVSLRELVSICGSFSEYVGKKCKA
jgi:hypothetical protein